MIMSTSNQRASNIFKSSQEPNTNKKNKKRHKILFNKIRPPINIPFNLGREFKKDVSTYEVYRQSSTICTEGWQPRIHSHRPEDPLRTDDQRWPTKTIISNIISSESTTLENIYCLKIPLKNWRRLEGWFISLKKRWLVPLSGEIYRTLPPSDSTIARNPSDSPCPNLGPLRNGTSWRPCVLVRASPSATWTAIFWRFSWSGRGW